MSDKRIRDKSIEEEKELKEKELKTEFVSVWKEYPRKEDKVNAEKDYIKARKEGVEMATILENAIKDGGYALDKAVLDKIGAPTPIETESTAA